MEYWLNFLPLVIYILIIVALIIGIVLGIKTIITMGKIEKIVDSVNSKVESLNSVFNIIDFTSEKLTGFVEKTIEFLSNLFSKLWYKKSLNKEEDIDE